MLVEGIAVCNALSSFLQGFVAYEEIRNEVDQEQLPGGKVALLLYYYCSREEYSGQGDKDDLTLQASFLVMMSVLVSVLMFVLM